MSVRQPRHRGRTYEGRPHLGLVVLKNESAGLRHDFTPESQTKLDAIGTEAVNAYGGRLKLETAHPINGDKNGLTIIGGKTLRAILREPASRLGRNSGDLARSIILGECKNLPVEPIDVTFGRLIVSRSTNALLASIEDPSGTLVAEHNEVISAMQRYERVSDLGIPGFKPHVTLGVLQPMSDEQIFSVAKQLSADYSGTALTLQPLR